MLSWKEKIMVGLIQTAILAICGLFIAAVVNLAANPIIVGG